MNCCKNYTHCPCMTMLRLLHISTHTRAVRGWAEELFLMTTTKSIFQFISTPSRLKAQDDCFLSWLGLASCKVGQQLQQYLHQLLLCRYEQRIGWNPGELFGVGGRFRSTDCFHAMRLFIAPYDFPKVAYSIIHHFNSSCLYSYVRRSFEPNDYCIKDDNK